MMRTQNAIPVENGKRFHGCTPLCVRPFGLAPVSRLRLLAADAILRKNASAIENAIRMPETLRDKYSLDITDSVGDTPIHKHRDGVH
jgi:hypothetical protein